jgi:hypothetical protein
VVVEDDKHTDDVYYVFRTFEEARLKANELVKEGMESYRHSEDDMYIGSDGSDGKTFCIQGEDSFTISIEEIEVPFENSVSG